MTSQAFHDLFGGPPRKPDTLLTRKEMDIARSIQEVAELVLLNMARHVKKETGMKHLCLAGGVALNCVANGNLLREKLFDDIWIQPAAGDAGGALGAAIFVWHQLLGNKRMISQRDSQSGSCLGPRFGPDAIEQWLKQCGYPYAKYNDGRIPQVVADFLVQEKIVGWFNGRMEYGPRALGNPTMQKVMNLKIKFRESFRPFAPSCLAEDVHEYFDLDRESPYMLLTAYVRRERRRTLTNEQQRLWGLEKLNVVRSDIPAVTHVDYSARIQTVHPDDNRAFYDVIKAFKERTGCGVIVNTSFNVRGEPIVCTPQDAYRCFMRTGMDVLVLENLVLEKQKQPEWHDDNNWKKEFVLD
jgi:carbamoyltransferase